MSSRKQSELIKIFVAGSTARASAEICEVNRNTATSFFMRLRELIARKLPSFELDGEVETDESYFGERRKGKRGRGAPGKMAVFGLLKRGGRVYAAIIPNARSSTLLPIIEEKVTPDNIVYTDTIKSYNALDVSAFHHRRINRSKIFAQRANHINRIEDFWNQAKRHMLRFNGIKPENFHLFLKEYQWHFNGGNHKDCSSSSLNSGIKGQNINS